MRTTGLLACLALVAPGWVSAETFYLRNQPNVEVMAEPSPGAAVVQHLAPGDAVELLSREAGYALVRMASGEEGWLLESELEATVPAALRLAQLEDEAAGLREQLAAARVALSRREGELRQARQAADTARAHGASRSGDLEATNASLREVLATREQEIAQLRQRVIDLEMAREASRLLAATTPPAAVVAAEGARRQELLVAALAGLLMALAGTWAGASSARRRLRRRYHGLEL